MMMMLVIVNDDVKWGQVWANPTSIQPVDFQTLSGGLAVNSFCSNVKTVFRDDVALI